MSLYLLSRIHPAGHMPINILNKNRKNKGRLVIVNLQKTHLDEKEGVLKINERCDFVMTTLMNNLGIHVEIPIDNNNNNCDNINQNKTKSSSQRLLETSGDYSNNKKRKNC